VNTWFLGQPEQARKLHFELLPLMHAMGIETNPIPVKAALALMGKVSPEIRLPLTAMTGPHLERLRSILEQNALL
jgi:4-hydroxy-tetrahydrodipicolinate synthase